MSYLNEYQWYTDNVIYALDKKLDDEKCRMKKAMSEWSERMEEQFTNDLIDDFVKVLGESGQPGEPLLQPLTTRQREIVAIGIRWRVHVYAQGVEAAMTKFNEI